MTVVTCGDFYLFFSINNPVHKMLIHAGKAKSFLLTVKKIESGHRDSPGSQAQVRNPQGGKNTG